MTIRETVAHLMSSCADLDDPMVVRVVTRDEHGASILGREATVHFVGGIHGYLVVEESELKEVKR